MSTLILHSVLSAPGKSKELLQSSIDNFGWIPNQSAYMAESPALLEAYQRAHDLFITSSLNDEQKTVVWITTGLANSCDYTVKAHLYIARASGVKPAILQALIDSPGDLPPSLLALKTFTDAVILCRGRLNAEAVADFFAAGFSSRNLLDVILGVSQKTMSTLVNGIADTNIDVGFLNIN